MDADGEPVNVLVGMADVVEGSAIVSGLVGGLPSSTGAEKATAAQRLKASVCHGQLGHCIPYLALSGFEQGKV